jgi:signal transduction histidine kinase
MTLAGGLSTHDGTLEAYAALAAHQLGEAAALMRASVSMLESERNRSKPAISAAEPGLAAGIERVQRFVDDLLGFSWVARTPPTVEQVDLGATLDAACEELAVILARTGATVRASDLPAISMDRSQARLAFVHLLRVALAAGARHVDVRVNDDAADVATIEVLDDGTPPADGTEDRAFEPFVLVRERGPLLGAGVSLALCRRIAEAHGGSIAISRVDGGGTMTSLRLPQPLRG